jgi:hypothetical protein
MPLDLGVRLQIEHADRLIAAVRREQMAGLGRDAGAVHARCVLNVEEHLARGAFDHHHVRRSRDEHRPVAASTAT